MTKDVSNTTNVSEIKNDLSHLAKTYHLSYKASRSTLRQHFILQKSKGNKDILILRPDKRNVVDVLNRSD